MGYIKIKIKKPNNQIWICPGCGSHRVQQKNDAGDFKFLCLACYWHGERQIIQSRPSGQHAGTEVNSVSYEDIIKILLSGKSIQEACQAFGVPLGKTVDGRLFAVRNKILRIYNAYEAVTGIQCTDVDFQKIHVTPDVIALLTSAIQEEEQKIRSSPRQSITFSK